MSATSDIDHDHFLTYAFTLQFKNKRLTSIFLKLEKLHTPPFLRDIIINYIDKYYNNGLVDDIIESSSTTYQKEINTCAHLQQRIGWEHCLRGRISISFHTPINRYYRQNHIGKRYTSSFWFRSIVNFLWGLHYHTWINYCNSIHNPDKTIRIITTAKSTLLNLVNKYILEAKILPKDKILFFIYKKLKYQAWSIIELQNWLSSARKILRIYRDQIVDAPIHTTSNLPSKHIVHYSPNNNHYTASPITKYYTKHNSYMIPTSTNSTLQNISNPTNTIASKLPSVRNPSPHSIKYSIPRVPSLNQLPTTNRTPNETNYDNINKHLVSELKQNNKKYSLSFRNLLSPYHISIDTTHGTNIEITITNYLSDNKLPISISVISSKLSQSTAKKQTNLDNITKNTKIVIDSPAQILQVSRTPTIFLISKEHNQ